MTTDRAAWASPVSITMDAETLELADKLADALHLNNRSAAVRAAIHAYAETVLADLTPAAGVPTSGSRSGA